ncbi:MFS transporter [Yersinia pseudotuberculosis]|uniref:MFS transporter n=1 Tax=Yersinia pseudotuberculosis TaxID=633 RepID=UPI0005E63779|nr:MFS transporter [Yersinia pseudotuberculosis]CND03849.1 major facilitator transporter [Yersinia pseudotuberculosis]
MSIQEVDKTNDLSPDPASSKQETPIHWSIPLALLACVLLAFFDKVSIAALFSDPAFQNALGIDFDTTRLGMLMTAFLLSYGFSSTFLSGIGDRFSPTKVLIGMMMIWGVLMVLMGLTRSYNTMIVLRILLGIAEGPLFPLAFAIVRHSFPQRLQARATMLWLLGTPIGAAIGFPLTLFILHRWGWEATFFIMGVLTLPVMLMVYYGLRHVKIERNIQSADGVRTPQEVATRKQDRHELFTSSHFWLVCIFNIAFLTYLWGINGWLPSYLIKGKGIDLAFVGYLASVPFVAMLVGEVLGAWFSDRLDRRALSCFLSLCGAGVGLIAVLYVQNTYAVIAAMAFSTFMWGVGAPNVFALLAKVISKQVSATAGGVFNGLGNFAGALAPVVMGALIATFNSMDSGLIFLVVMALTGSMVLLPLLRRY